MSDLFSEGLARGVSSSKLPLTSVLGSILAIYTSSLWFIYYMYCEDY